MTCRVLYSFSELNRNKFRVLITISFKNLNGLRQSVYSNGLSYRDLSGIIFF